VEHVLDVDDVYVANLLKTVVILGFCSLGLASVYCILTSLCYVSGSLLGIAADVDREWIEVTFLSLKTQTHLEIMHVIFFFGLSFHWQSIWTNYVPEPRMTQ
jgi:hypothetical protein